MGDGDGAAAASASTGDAATPSPQAAGAGVGDDDSEATAFTSTGDAATPSSQAADAGAGDNDGAAAVPLSVEVAVTAGTDVLASLEEMSGFNARRLVAIPPDGDCMFGAVATVAGLAQDAQVLRLAAVAFLRCNPGRVLANEAHFSLADWARTVADVPNFDDVLRMLECSAEPGGYMVAVLAHLLARPITVLTRGWNPITYMPEGSTASRWDPHGLNSDHLAILYSGTHYDALVLEGAPSVDIKFTIAQILSFQREEDPAALVGTYSLRDDDPRSTQLMVRALVFHNPLRFFSSVMSVISSLI